MSEPAGGVPVPGPKAPERPAVFVGHGNPMNALERNRYTEAWRAFGAGIPKPRAILVISAHWCKAQTGVPSSLRGPQFLISGY